MNISRLSFGKKIPIAKCKIQDKHTGNMVPATCYEFDCKDISDIIAVNKAKRFYNFKNTIVENMSGTFMLKREYPRKEENSYFIMEDINGEIIGISQVRNRNGNTFIDFIESQSESKYKYIGQTLLAGIARESLQDGMRKIVVPIPIDSSLGFYIDKCGFKQYINGALKMNRNQIEKFIKRTEEKTKSPIKNITA